MLVLQDAWVSTDLPQGGYVTIGNYDGFHRGQLAILERVTMAARAHEVSSVLVTFDPHPVGVLAPREAPALLTTPSQKEELVAAAGVDVLLVVKFDREVASVPAERFVREFLVGRLAVRGVVVGSRFRFGQGKTGDVTLLQSLGGELGFEVVGVEELLWRGAPISSTRVRTCVADGRVEEAAELLARPYELVGEVARGDRMGKRLGWPTVNLSPDNALLPHDGVYATRVAFSALATTFDSVTNIGTRPTVYENYQRVVESHVLDFNADVYGQRVKLSFYKQLREEMIFPTIMDLSVQIGRDVEATREYFSRQRRLEELGLEGTATPSPGGTS